MYSVQLFDELGIGEQSSEWLQCVNKWRAWLNLIGWDASCETYDWLITLVGWKLVKEKYLGSSSKKYNRKSGIEVLFVNVGAKIVNDC